MIRRHQLPVASPVSPAALARAARAALRPSAAPRDALSAELAARFGARAAALADSGTSALVLALRLAAGEGGTVAFPAYACIDLTAAALYARVQVRLYDLDPATLSPDLDSVRRVLDRGVDAVVVAHLYGFPADVPGVTALAAARGVPVIEDAAQGAGGRLGGVPLGGLGGLSVLSFGRGKGLSGGHGGALMAISPDWAEAVAACAATWTRGAAGWRDLAAAAAQWTLGRPALYGIPASIPGLRLGEMVYRPAHEPRPMSVAAATLVRSALRLAESEVETRRRNAAVLRRAAAGAPAVGVVDAISGGAPGYLRFPVRDYGNRGAAPALGIMPGYPRTLARQDELRPCLCAGEGELPGAAELERSLLTLPVHSRVAPRDIDALRGWLRSPAAPRPALDAAPPSRVASASTPVQPRP